MEMRKLVRTMGLTETLRNSTRHSWIPKGRHESIVEHSWGLCLFACSIRNEFPGANIDKVLHMYLLHDIGETSTGDILSFQRTEADEVWEAQVVYEWVNSLPVPYNTELRALYEGMDALGTLGAGIHKVLSKMEVLVQYNQFDSSTWLPLEYELNLKYGVGQAEFHGYLWELRQMVSDDCMARVKQEGPEKYRELGWEQP